MADTTSFSPPLSPLEARVRAWAEARLSPERLVHTAGVVETAARLAQRHGVGHIASLRLAGWIHDAAKALPRDELLHLAKQMGCPIRPIERQEPLLLHGPVAVWLARVELGLDDPVVDSAVTFHTTGDPAMSAADRVFYLADGLEPSRAFPWAAQGRILAEEDIDRALLFVLSNKLRRLLHKGALIDPRAVELRNRLLLDGVTFVPREDA